MSIVDNPNRQFRITSSEIWKIVPKGTRPMTSEEKERHKKSFPKSRKQNTEDDNLFLEGGETYLRQIRQSRKRRRPLDTFSGNAVTAWGDICERRVFQLIGLQYQDLSNKTSVHPDYPDYWAGSTDLLVPNKVVGDIKGYHPENFCNYADCLLMQDIEVFKKDFKKEYWQLVSNACIHGVDYAEAVLYQPNDREIKDILSLIENSVTDMSGDELWQWKNWHDKIQAMIFNEKPKNPFQPNDSGYPNLIQWQFEVPKEDKIYLEQRVKSAIKKIEI